MMRVAAPTSRRKDNSTMADRLLIALRKFAEDKNGLREQEQRLATTERKLIQSVSRLLTRVGYRVLPLNGHDVRASARGIPRRLAPKRLSCPKCDRRFSHPLPMARHMSATHGIKKAGRKSKPKRQGKAA
jgi:uncharacterized C2H2 Zn-finger protein